MNKKLVGVITAGIVVAVAAIVLSTMITKQPEPQTQAHETPQPATTQTPGEATAPTTQAPGVYADYTADRVATTSGTKVLFFHAPWCPQCRELEKSIQEGAIPANVTIFKVDYDSNQDLRRKYGVTLQTTLVKIDDSGALVKKYVAYNKPSLQALIENVL